MATDLERALARIAELEQALQALHGFTPDDNVWMRRAQEAEQRYFDANAAYEETIADMQGQINELRVQRDNALDLAEARKYEGVASPPPAPIHGPRSDAADALRYMMESRYIAPNPDLIKTVRGVGLADLSRILAKNVRP